MRRLMGLVFFLLLLGSCPARAALQINEILASNGIYQNGHAYEWIEIKNTGDKKVSLAGAKLTFTRKKETQTYTFPEGSTLAAGGYAVVYCVENDPIPARSKNFYANISLSKKGGTELWPDLLKEAGLPSPFEPGALKDLAEKVEKLLKTLV